MVTVHTEAINKLEDFLTVMDFGIIHYEDAEWPRIRRTLWELKYG
jgi:hypothetical protein